MKIKLPVIKMREKIEKVIDEHIRPGLQMDGGDIELVDIDSDGIVKVRLKGACGGCPMSQITLTMGVERKLKEEIPEVKGVVAVP
jgi:Fe-S cluster biogenesis protein NfuA